MASLLQVCKASHLILRTIKETEEKILKMNYNELTSHQLLKIKTLGELKAAGYISRSVKQELRDNQFIGCKISCRQLYLGIRRYCYPRY